MGVKYLYMGACCEEVLLRDSGETLTGYIEKGSDADLALHQRARELEDENYLEDWAAEINDDYFDGELTFKLRWSHTRTRTLGGAKRKVLSAGYAGYTSSPFTPVPGTNVLTASYRLAYHAYTDTEDVVEYLLMHEMAHFIEMNHHYNFWKIVATNSAAVNGHRLYHGKDYPISLHEYKAINPQRTDIRSRQGGYLATGGYPEGQTLKSKEL